MKQQADVQSKVKLKHHRVTAVSLVLHRASIMTGGLSTKKKLYK